MGLLKFLIRGFGGLFILLALSIIFIGLFFNYGINNLHILTESANTKIPDILNNNKALFEESIFKDMEITQDKLAFVCLQDPEKISQEFCNNLENMKTEEEIKDGLFNVFILKMQDQIKLEIQEFEQTVKSKLDQIRTYLNYVIPLGLLIFLFGAFFVFLAEKFKWKAALFYISLKTCITSIFVAAANYYLMNLTPERIETITNLIPIAKSEESVPGLAFKLMSELLTDWIRASARELFFVSIIIFIASLLITVIMFILKHKKPNTKGKIKKTKKVKKPKK
ncbi:MAG: hypothetical protein ISS23_00055 [Nanoarchaeota archaeon]|nr:hypothetical protein [Nanoarchaeota archaeon]